MRTFLFTMAVLAAAETVSAHASIMQPKPIAFDELRDTYNAPLAPDFSNFPCKGLHNRPFAASETWKAGQNASFTIDTSHIAAHGGGSCQASISHDGGKTFEVLHSWIGDCPRGANGNDVSSTDQQFSFLVPSTEPAGEALFAWTWFAAIANREMYMNCAFVTIDNPNANAVATTPRPALFVGFLQPGVCNVAETFNLDFPEPGSNPTYATDTKFQPKKPSGSGCGSAESGGGEPILKKIVGNAPNPGPPAASSEAAPTMSAAPTVPTVTAPEQANMVTITQTVTAAATSVTVVTSYVKAYILVETTIPNPVPSGLAKRGSTHPSRNINARNIAREDKCNFKSVMKIGGQCDIPSGKSSQWEPCVWQQFCPCLDANLGPSDLTNFVKIKTYCNCLLSNIGCETGVKKRDMDLVFAKRNNKFARSFKS